MTVVGGRGQAVPKESLVGPLTTVYGVLMFHRYNCLSALQHLLTLIATQGRASDLVIVNRVVHLYAYIVLGIVYVLKW